MSVATLSLASRTPVSLTSRFGVSRTLDDHPTDHVVLPGYPGDLPARLWSTSPTAGAGMFSGPDTAGPIETPIRDSPSVSAAAPLTSADFALTLARLRSLIADEEEEDRPSQLACERAVQLLRKAAEHVAMRFPVAIVATGPGRSVRFLWQRNEKEVRLVIGGSPANRSYLYWRMVGDSGVDETLEADRIAQYLTWLVQGG